MVASASRNMILLCIRDATSAAISASEQLRDHSWLDGRACISTWRHSPPHLSFSHKSLKSGSSLTLGAGGLLETRISTNITDDENEPSKDTNCRRNSFWQGKAVHGSIFSSFLTPRWLMQTFHKVMSSPPTHTASPTLTWCARQCAVRELTSNATLHRPTRLTFRSTWISRPPCNWSR